MRFRTALAGLGMGAALVVGGVSAPAQAAPHDGTSSALALNCTTGKNLTNGWGKCTTAGSYKWLVRVYCTLGGSGESSVVTGPTRTNAYCNWGHVEDVFIERV
ncbi:hypothetical protein SAMN05428945_1028 [Streptomyces sp. 2224.1]|uniref:hypothetical protein n=1 Tax=unclassified Streptomyces TaxID=2593676 RepID=UPI00088E24E2|nr:MULTISPECIES: hypothetical protein [unclassified Streptomyces]PBC84366.1 hypothetical protein BX261_4354 [Streptomyces sp. 2321.6]SDR31802.1 hypothetical protein SAMN05216511_2846 [Streptomyces sp. KS_16]SEB74012.1 hypothetical protein SAMN05428945_1028 [Streptomyces sp. 2224.1]SED28863.1 hypothetical protein SAMN05428940_4381 [Streptomyces sp. 2133.1]SEE54918.1 hypothetical protein SAMN05428954_2953 [Streptomyces sp. 2112.3]